MLSASLAVREAWVRFPGRLNWHSVAKVATFLRSCVAQALSCGDIMEMILIISRGDRRNTASIMKALILIIVLFTYYFVKDKSLESFA